MGRNDDGLLGEVVGTVVRRLKALGGLVRSSLSISGVVTDVRENTGDGVLKSFKDELR